MFSYLSTFYNEIPLFEGTMFSLTVWHWVRSIDLEFQLGGIVSSF